MKLIRSRKSHPTPRTYEGNASMQYCLVPEQMNGGNQVELLVDGDALRAMLDSIRSAQSTILMDSYIFNDDGIGREFSDALCERAREGIRVHLVVDGVGTINVSGEFFDQMRNSGVYVLVYHPLVPWRKGFDLLRRNHRKLLIVDGVEGFAGGVNVGDEWVEKARGGKGWHDVHLRIHGPAVAQMQKLALSTWTRWGHGPLDPQLFAISGEEPAGLDEGVVARVIGTHARKKTRAIKRTYMHAIRQATDYIYIANAYFLPDMGIRRALRNASRRGVDVRVMVPDKGDVWPVQVASEALFTRLMRWGIRIYRWKGAVLHAKTAVIDDCWATVGSYNMDRRSLAFNLELNVNIVDADVAVQLREIFVSDQDNCERIDPAQWAQRSWLSRLFETLFFKLRRFM